MAQTRRSAAALDWQLASPAVVWDVYRPEDISRLAEIDRQSDTEGAIP